MIEFLQLLVPALVSFYRTQPLLAIGGSLALIAGACALVYGTATNWPARQQADRQIQSVQGSPGSVNIQGNTIQKFEVHIYQNGQLVVPPAAMPAAPSSPFATIPIVENGGFEDGTVGWGTGFFESYFASPNGAALMFNHAVARWYIDDQKAHGGSRALHVDQTSTYVPDRFSSFSQRIKVKPGQRYEVKYWAYLESTDGRGAFSLRVVPSRKTELREWDKFRKKIDPARIGTWQEARLEFDSGIDAVFDLRFAAESAMKLWLDDVSVTPINPG